MGGFSSLWALTEALELLVCAVENALLVGNVALEPVRDPVESGGVSLESV